MCWPELTSLAFLHVDIVLLPSARQSRTHGEISSEPEINAVRRGEEEEEEQQREREAGAVDRVRWRGEEMGNGEGAEVN